jgi:PAB1-binding protein PBP1
MDKTKNSHLLEERGLENDDKTDEESKYSSVYRNS